MTLIDSNLTGKLTSDPFLFFQTRSLPESHTGVNIANVLREAVHEWNLLPNPRTVTDNASNRTVVTEEFESLLHVGCLARTLNLA